MPKYMEKTLTALFMSEKSKNKIREIMDIAISLPNEKAEKIFNTIIAVYYVGYEEGAEDGYWDGYDAFYENH